ncbi:MAG: phage virion morphogenesis protein [Bacteroidales bacterium]
MELNNLHKLVLKDIKHELEDEFDLNFRRQAFFDRPWKSRSPDLRTGGALLVDSGALRRSLQSSINGNSIVFSSDKEYANIHNEGGEITVTEKMRRYFWARYMAISPSVLKTNKGALRSGKANTTRSDKANFYKAMALKKSGDKIKIPQRQFIGEHANIDKSVEEIAHNRLKELIDNLHLDISKKI